MSSNQGKGMCKGVEETEKSPDVTVSVNSSGNVSLNSATTTPTSDIYVSTAGSYTGVCARVGVTYNGSTVENEGVCKCSCVAESLTTTHLTASSSPYTISSDASGSGEESYKLVPINGGALSFGSVGDIKIGN